MPIDSTPSGSELAAEWGINKVGSKGSSYVGLPNCPTSKVGMKGSDFIGKSNVTISAPNGYVDAYSTTTASITLTLQSNGNTYTTKSGSGGDTVNGDDWYTPNTTNIGNSYRVRFTKTAGTSFGTSVSGTIYQLNTNRAVSLSSSSGLKTSTIQVDILNNSNVVIATGTVTLGVEGGAI